MGQLCTSLRNLKSTYNFLDHVHDFLLDKVQALRVTSRGPADDIVDLDVIIFLAHPTTIHRIGEFDEDRVFLHDALNVLSANTDDPLVILIRHMERDRRRHLLLDQIQAILG